MKRLAARASLQRPRDNQILTPVDLFKFCDEHVKGITSFFVSRDEVEDARNDQEERFKSADTVAGTRENHHFVPIDEKWVQVSRVSNDTSSFIANVVSGDQFEVAKLDIQPGQYVACVYDKKWWIGNVCEVSAEEKDAFINFLHPHGPAKKFHWPQKERDVCWVPEEHIFSILPVPSADTMGRNYSFPKKTLDDVAAKYKAMY